MRSDQVLERALACAGEVVRGAGTAELEGPTPCPRWSVRQVLNHVVGQLRVLESRLTATPVPNAVAPGELPPRDLVSADPVDAYEETALTIRLAARDADAPADAGDAGDAGQRASIDVQCTEVVVHAWDLAVATGQDTRLDDELAQHCLRVARRLTEGGRSGLFAVEIDAPPAAAPMDELAAFCGRVP